MVAAVVCFDGEQRASACECKCVEPAPGCVFLRACCSRPVPSLTPCTHADDEDEDTRQIDEILQDAAYALHMAQLSEAVELAAQVRDMLSRQAVRLSDDYIRLLHMIDVKHKRALFVMRDTDPLDSFRGARLLFSCIFFVCACFCVFCVCMCVRALTRACTGRLERVQAVGRRQDVHAQVRVQQPP